MVRPKAGGRASRLSGKRRCASGQL
uniref:Uncharacterized protein n=1 Tax=Arundo donax TaxID=35708 RepID=A0A0A9FNJ7_ARUDO